MSWEPVSGGLALVVAAMGFAVRAHLLGGSSPGWPSAPWWVRAALWAAAAVCSAQGAVLLAKGAEAVGRGELAVYLAVAAYGAVGAINLWRQRAAGGRLEAAAPAWPARRGEPPAFPGL